MDAATRKISRRVPLESRQRTQHSCDRCKSRKQKCHQVPGEDRCRHCERYNYDCTTNKPRKQRIYGSVDLVRSRIEALEGLVKKLIPDADLSSVDSMREIERSLNNSLPEMGCSKSRSPQPQSIQEKQPDSVDLNEELVKDQQGQEQYIGPASSYFFQMKLRTLLGSHRQGPKCHMLLFGRNPSEENLMGSAYAVLTETEIREIPMPSQMGVGVGAVPYPVPLLDTTVIDGLIRAYFDYVNVDFPILHEASFLHTFDIWRVSPHSVERPWVCGLLCVLILGRRISPLGTAETQQQKWWTHIELILPSIIFTSNIHSIQAFMLAALHLHNTNHRDACWTLTGAAARIAIAIGLHRDETICKGPRLAQELRKSLWWTLYSFEQIQVSSHDRPSAIEDTLCSTTSPHERTLGVGTPYWPPDYTIWSTQLVSILSRVCRALPNATSEAGLAALLSPVSGLLGDLARWHDSLPQHLSLSVLDILPNEYVRPVLLLHIQYHYTVSLLTRYSLLRYLGTRSEMLSAEPKQRIIETAAKICCESGRKSCELLLQLDARGKFNAVTWWDIYFVYSSTLVLTVSIMWDRATRQCEAPDNGALSLLHDCAAVVTLHSLNPMVPGTMRRWIGIICDLDVLAHEKLGPAPKVPFNNQSEFISYPSTANAIVDPAPSNFGTIPPYYNNGAGMQSSVEQYYPPMNQPMMSSHEIHNNPVLEMPYMNDNNGYVSWDSIESMLLGAEAYNPPFDWRM
ncbi:hypothetical protein BO94DRAFT_530928 [Aspergillus sclerotioniger CBS 115572]|uniref:Zn(2)-C6 fungal-type domain-containing protein n=1 Tax=Aspergillus sclerotioniger CBS 115572 TaxID=1450535 RepID=A0A317X964_9EURO|nr:hypothetical protein BO94DRAFT_530928 [Aspergillus sclerotioniger CBS 115572]PWY95039.1 hypothetical protein BO94DRAFT_530928 [Aspergillus sclerotioniger CBS 115572]